MQTRRQANLKDINIRDLLLDESQHAAIALVNPSPVPPKVRVHRVRRREMIAAQIAREQESPVNSSNFQSLVEAAVQALDDQKQSLLKDQSQIIVDQRAQIELLLTQLRFYQSDSMREREEEVESIAPDVPFRVLVLDTESFNLNVQQDEPPLLLPLQIAWGVYEWNPDLASLECIASETKYVKEVFDNPFIRSQLYDLSPNCLQRHEDHLAHMGDKNALTNAQTIIEELCNTITVCHVSTLAAYNISWDFQALRNMIERLCAWYPPSVDPSCDNPFNPLSMFYVDLMHLVVTKYGAELVSQGIQDGTIHRPESESDKLMLRKNNRKYSKTVYSAEYALKYFFGVTQQHLADDDVIQEALLLEKGLCDFGASGIEYNICYPQQSCYQRILHLASHMYVDPFDIGTESAEDEDEDVDEDAGSQSAPKRRRLVRRSSRKTSSEQTVCLFGESTETDETHLSPMD